MEKLAGRQVGVGPGEQVAGWTTSLWAVSSKMRVTQLSCEDINTVGKRNGMQCESLLRTLAGCSDFAKEKPSNQRHCSLSLLWRNGNGAWLEAHRKRNNMHDRTSKNRIDMCYYLSVDTNTHIRRCSRDTSKTKNKQALSLACKARAPDGWKLRMCCSTPLLRLHGWKLLLRLQMRRLELARLHPHLSWRACQLPLHCAAS